MLKIENLYAGYIEKNHILNGINLSIHENEVLAIVGQNGAGKSTLAKAILGLLPYASGKIYFENQLISDMDTEKIVKRGLSFFMQGGRIFPNLTVEENLNFAGNKMQKADLKKRMSEVKLYFDLFKNVDRANMKASYLSGGEQHQLAFAMVMIRKPKLLILDEPSAGLSPKNVKKIYTIFQKIREKEKIAILLIEQNVDMAIKYSDRICLLMNGEIQLTEYSNKITLQKIGEYFFENQRKIKKEN